MKKLYIVISVMIWFSVSLSAETNSSVGVNEEIGIPYIEPDKGVIDSAVLAPDGNSFYTLKGNLVTQWQITPLKKLHSFKTNIMTYHKNGRAKYRIHINISNDNKRIILYSPKEIQLWDIKRKKHLKTNKFKDYVYSGVRSKYGFLTIGEENILTIWNDENLTLKNTIRMNKFIDRPAYSMLNGDNILIITYFRDALCFNLDTFKILDKIRGNGSKVNPLKNLDSLTKGFISRVKNRYSHKFNSYTLHWYMNNLGYPRPLATWSSRKNTNEIALRQYITISYPTFFSYLFVELFLNKLGKIKKYFYIIYQFDDAIILRDKRRKFFIGSGKIKKYLKMRTKDGKITPINDATFKKYNRQIKLKD